MATFRFCPGFCIRFFRPTQRFLRFWFDAGGRKRENMTSMNVKRWLLWVCLALLFISQVLLFRANQRATAAQADAREAREQASQLQIQIDELKASSVANLSLDNARLRSQNQQLATKMARANNDLTQLMLAKQKTDAQLQTARQALQLQQDHLQQLTVENQQVQAAAQPAAPATPEPSADEARELCLQNLRAIDAAKQLWALEYNKDAKDTPTPQDLLPYLKGNAMPVCPAGGVYLIGSMDQPPICSVPGHVMP